MANQESFKTDVMEGAWDIYSVGKKILPENCLGVGKRAASLCSTNDMALAEATALRGNFRNLRCLIKFD